MLGPVELRTDRLRLRNWSPDDLEGLARLNADESVMEFMWSGPQTREQSKDWLDQRIEIEGDGECAVFAAERLDTGAFIGWIGLNVPAGIPELADEVEVGWRLLPEHWGRGFATEGARASIAWGFTDRGLRRIISTYDPENLRSRRVMDKLGMREWKRVVHPLYQRELLVLELTRDEPSRRARHA